MTDAAADLLAPTDRGKLAGELAAIDTAEQKEIDRLEREAAAAHARLQESEFARLKRESAAAAAAVEGARVQFESRRGRLRAGLVESVSPVTARRCAVLRANLLARCERLRNLPNPAAEFYGQEAAGRAADAKRIGAIFANRAETLQALIGLTRELDAANLGADPDAILADVARRAAAIDNLQSE